jgi:hypothetical protein
MNADPVRVEREDVPVMFVRTRDTQAAIEQAWSAFERTVGLKGRKFFGVFDAAAREYRVCAQLEEGDEPEALGFERGTLPGGAHLRARLRGEPPGVYARIAPTVRRLLEHPDADDSRPAIEYYRSRDVIDVLVPVSAAR